MYLRSYKDEDFETLYALDIACFAPRFRFSRALMQKTVSSDHALTRLACERGGEGKENVLGFGAVTLESHDGLLLGYVATLDVAPGNRGKGLGGVLMLALEEAVLELGANWMILHVYVKNTPAIHLYEKLGYMRLGRESGFYGNGFDAWLYRKQLSPPEDPGV